MYIILQITCCRLLFYLHMFYIYLDTYHVRGPGRGMDSHGPAPGWPSANYIVPTPILSLASAIGLVYYPDKQTPWRLFLLVHYVTRPDFLVESCLTVDAHTMAPAASAAVPYELLLFPRKQDGGMDNRSRLRSRHLLSLYLVVRWYGAWLRFHRHQALLSTRPSGGVAVPWHCGYDNTRTMMRILRICDIDLCVKMILRLLGAIPWYCGGPAQAMAGAVRKVLLVGLLKDQSLSVLL